MNKVEIAALLRAFIAEEDAAFAAGGCGKMWVMKHQLIRPVMSKAEKVLEEEERVRLYLHFMRLNHTALPPVKSTEFEQVRAAYDVLLPYLDNPTLNKARRHVLLYVFGYDDAGTLPDGVGEAADWEMRAAFVKKVSGFTNFLGMRQKAESFLPFVEDAPRMLETLRHLDYRHDRRYEGEPDYDGILYDVMNLDFWGMILVIAMDAETRAAAKADFLSSAFNTIPQRDRHREIFGRFLAEVKAAG